MQDHVGTAAGRRRGPGRRRGAGPKRTWGFATFGPRRATPGSGLSLSVWHPCECDASQWGCGSQALESVLELEAGQFGDSHSHDELEEEDEDEDEDDKSDEEERKEPRLPSNLQCTPSTLPKNFSQARPGRCQGTVASSCSAAAPANAPMPVAVADFR